MTVESIITLVAAILALIASIAAIINSNFKRYARERWWERKAKAYEDIISALSNSVHYYRTLINEELGIEKYTAGKRDKFNKIEGEGFNTIRKATDMGGFIISNEASSVLSEYWKKNEDGIDPQDWYKRFEANFEKTQACLTKITICAKNDLKIN